MLLKTLKPYLHAVNMGGHFPKIRRISTATKKTTQFKKYVFTSCLLTMAGGG
jgi:hypothetical protein